MKSTASLPKLRVGGVLLFLILAILFFLYRENTQLDIEEISVSSEKIPEAFRDFRIVLLSDGHGARFGKDNEILLDAVAAANPDLIVYAGDIIDRAWQLDSLAPLARGLAEIAPTYYVSGNHEWAVRKMDALFSLLTRCGVTPLRNEYVPLTRGGETIFLCGIDDPNGPADQKKTQALYAELSTREGDGFSILLAHRNNLFETYAACGFDLVLSGHGHGGLIRLPFTDGLIGTDKQLFPPYTNGLYAYGKSQLVVSRGLGNVGRTFRLFNRPHIPVILLTPC
ncbi:MAG: metallophosphoesterase [Oscillospiraceae bacterium]|nr:metallophosphoesterase [Oscillospiraceae bacterium]